MYRVVLLDADGEPTVSRPLGSAPVYIGRADTNDLVLDDALISARHAAIWTRGARVFVEDLRSRNGVFVGEERVRQRREIAAQTEVGIAGVARLRVERTPDSTETGPLLLVEDVLNRVHLPVRTDRFRIGGGPDHDLLLPGTDDEATLLVDPDGRTWLGRADGSLHPLPLGAAFEVGGRAFRVRGGPLGASATLERTSTGYPYHLEVELDGPTGPRAEIVDPASGVRVAFTAPNRAVLLYLLAQRATNDREAGVAASDRGWCPDAEVASGLWGRDGEGRNLNVLVTRVRNDVRRAGLDPWFLEKRQGCVRVRLEQIRVSR